MAELSGFWTTGGTKGDQQVSYTQAQWSTASMIMSACAGFEGVAPGVLNGLSGTAGASKITIGTGAGMCDGKWFLNDAAQDVTIVASAGGTTRIDRVVLRADWANFNVSVYRIDGTNAASPTAPAIVQTSGTTYDIMLFQCLVDSAGTVTVTDERVWASRSVTYRQGGNATDWSATGATNYVPTNVRIQCGVTTSSASGSVAITFPVAFSNLPLVYLMVDGTSEPIYTYIYTLTAAAFTFSVFNDADARVAKTVRWLAIGPK